MSMRYTVNEWCATCGKAKQYSGVLDNSQDSVTTTTPPEMCECNNTISIRPVNTAPPTQFDVTYRYNDLFSTPAYHFARLIPDSMQEIEQMVRRVVSEELAKAFSDMTQDGE